MRRILPFFLALIVVILCFTIPIYASRLGSPQDLDGLQVANIVYYLGDSFSFSEPSLSSDFVVSTTAYTSGLDLAALITSLNTGNNTKIRFNFIWDPSAGMDFNVICLKNVPSDFKITVSASGTSSMTGSSYSQAFNYIDQSDGWYKYDTFSTSATQTPVFSNVTSLWITIDGGSAQLSTLADDSIILSLSILPYSLGLSADLQYDQGYRDAQKVYSENLQQEKQNSYDAGLSKGYSQGYANAQMTLVPEAYEEGKDDGYIIGKNEGLELGSQSDLKQLIFSIPEAHLTALEGFTNWELLGYNLYDLLGGLAVLVIIGAIIKIGFKVIL